ncbi:hypothetical protein KEM52_005636 [Ascosphaera acerosa]|nr:hypothetical protein KEM52_005636 [Ascosphaera acerosa]
MATHRSICLVRDSHFPSARVVGEGSGTGEKLAHFIRRHVREEEDAVTTTAAAASRSDDQTDAAESATGGVDDGCPDRCRRLLFLVGETHRDDIPRILADPAQPEQERFQVDEMVVYETGVMDLFPDDFAQVVEQAKQRSNVIWVVVFSPTGCEQMLRILRKGPYEHAETEGSDDAADRQQNASKRCFIATIGPTTRDFLANRYGVVADVCADAPTPDAIQRGIDAFMEEHQIVC